MPSPVKYSWGSETNEVITGHVGGQLHGGLSCVCWLKVHSMAGGRPTDLTPALLAKAKGYLASLKPDLYNEVSKTWDVDLPSVAGLACYLDVSRETIYAWAKDEENVVISDTLTKVQRTQEQKLIKGGVGGAYNPSFSKLLMTKHGYADKVDSDVTTGGEKINELTPAMIIANAAAAKAYEEAIKKSLLE